jgi:translation initiation factor 3 subunit G
VPRTVAERKEWPKFGDSANDGAGVNSATTVVSDEVQMQFLSTKEEEKVEQQQAPAIASMKSIKCQFCKGDHWSAKCPHRDLLQDKVTIGATKDAGASSGAYKPPSMRAGAGGASAAGGTGAASGKKPDFMSAGKGSSSMNNKDDFTVRVSNLPEEATETDIQELFKSFGRVNRVFLAKDKTKNVSRGFAFVTFGTKDDAQRAIWGVNDYGYHHLILKVEWAK